MLPRRWPSFGLVLGLAVILLHARLEAALEISEFLAENHAGLQDEDGDASDWIELRNSGLAALNTSGYFLTDDPQRLDKWALPARSLDAGNYLIVFASGKNRVPPAGTWHANFSLKSSGEYLALTRGGQVVQEFSPEFPPQLADVSYGMMPPQMMGHPTPGAANDPAPPGPREVSIQPAGGTFSGTINVTLSSITPGAQLRYTTDGSAPTEASSLYAGSFAITTTMRLHARAFKSGQVSAISGAVWVKLSADLSAYQSPLPLLILENFNGGNIPIKNLGGSDGAGSQQVAQQAASWILKERSSGIAQMIAPAQLAGEIGIRGRGYISTTWTQKPYALEPRNAAGETVAVSPLGLPSNNDWVLYFPDPGTFRDPSMLYNAFPYQLSRNLGRYAAKFRFVEVFLNTNGGDLQLADRRGVYLLLEKISRGSERLDFSPLSADGNSGGCLLTVNRMDALPEIGSPTLNGSTMPQFFHTAGPNRLLQTPANTAPVAGDDLPTNSKAFFNFDQPSGYSISPAQRTAVELWFRNFEDVLYDDVRWRDPVLGYRRYLKVKDFVGGYLLQNFVRHTDAMNLSLYPWLGDDRQLRLGPVWDMNFGGYGDQGGPASALFYHSSSLWFPRLFTDPDFLQDYIDLWSQWRRTGMTDAALAAVIDAHAAEITTAKAVAQGVPNATEWTNRITAMKTWVQGRAAFFDQSFAPVPSLSPASGNVTSGTVVTMSAAGEALRQTADNTDPRLSGGGVSPSASSATAVTLTADARITVRSLTTGTYPWSGPRTATYAVDAEPATAGTLRISEIHYHPLAPSVAEMAAGFTSNEEFEFVELTNIGTSKISLLEVRAVRSGKLGIAFDFSTGSQWTLQPGARLIIGKNPAALQMRYGAGLAVAGAYEGNLSNDGDTVILQTVSSVILQRVTYSDLPPWPVAADGAGFSLTWRGGDPNLPTQWRTSQNVGGTPGGHDGVFYVGASPAAWATYALGVLPQTQLAGSTFRFTPPDGADDADYELEESTNLREWFPTTWAYDREIHVPGQPAERHWTPFAARITPPLFLRLRANRR